MHGFSPNTHLQLLTPYHKINQVKRYMLLKKGVQISVYHNELDVRFACLATAYMHVDQTSVCIMNAGTIIFKTMEDLLA